MTGGLHLEVLLSGGAVRRARLYSARPVALSQAMVGRPAKDVPAAVERLFALCGRSQRIAAWFAIEAARGRTPSEAARHEAVQALAAERVGEHLRSTFTTAASLGLQVTAGEMGALRTAIAATLPDARVAPLAGALAVLGLDGDRPTPASWAMRLLDSAGPEADSAEVVDALSPEDDPAVLAGLARSGVSYAAQPHLQSRRPETGPVARSGGSGAMRDRLAARFAEIRRAAALLRDGREDAPTCWIASGALPDGAGFAAVETPRGRMHQLIAVDAEDRVARCHVLAPTEWNFHPEGPFIHALRGLQIGAGGMAEDRIRWLVGLFDPCVGCTLDLREIADA